WPKGRADPIGAGFLSQPLVTLVPAWATCRVIRSAHMTEAHLSAPAGDMERSAMKAEVFLPDDYRPAEGEPFMNDRQLEYFRCKLIIWKQELLGQSAETLGNLTESGRNVPDLADRASEETDRA